jgi:hypothetical protein
MSSIVDLVHFVVEMVVIVVHNYQISCPHGIKYHQYIIASSSSVSTCQLRKPMICSPSGLCITRNRLAGCRISFCFDFGDHPNEDVLYLQLENHNP